jgi:nitrogen fixation NifU-like protein
MDEIRDLYQQVILDHHKSPKNFREIEDADRTVEGDNPLCGDHLHVYVKFSDDDERELEDVSFEGSGCAISRASASLMTEIIQGKGSEDVLSLSDDFISMVTTETDEEPDTEGLGKLEILAGVREYPVRVKCATLAWHTLKSAIKGDKDRVSTED